MSRKTKRKGIVLAGGFGTRLHPLTQVISKQLLPVYDKPMIFYPLGTLKQMQLTDIAIIVKKGDKELFERLLGDGRDYDMHFTYFEQEKPNGVAEAFIICEDFLEQEGAVLILGDNIFATVMQPVIPDDFNYIFGYRVKNPERYGVIVYDGLGDKRVIEKPKTHISDIACVGLYAFDNTCVERAKQLTPSKRGELEIADLINSYCENRKSIFEIKLPDGAAWFDCGNVDELLECSNYLRALKNRTNIKLGL